MKIAVLIIAHNEEEHIGKCIQSLLAQTKKADEILLINHNSTERTGEIARAFPVTVVDYMGPSGAAYARMHGLERVHGDAILCIDADAVAAPNWIETMLQTLERPDCVLAGSWVRSKGTLYGSLLAPVNYIQCTRSKVATEYLWGASFALWKRDCNFAIEALRKSIELSNTLTLTYNPDDYWLALFMQKRGSVVVTNRTWVLAQSKELTTLAVLRRSLRSLRTVKTIRSYVQSHGLPTSV